MPNFGASNIDVFSWTARSRRWIAVLTLVALNSGCGPGGPADTLESELRNAANEMNSRQQAEFTFSYEPHLDAPYYYIVVSPGSVRAQDLRTLGLSAETVEIFPDCMSTGQPFIAVVSRERANCLQPITYPKIVTTLVVGRARGVATEVVLRRSDAGAEVFALR